MSHVSELQQELYGVMEERKELARQLSLAVAENAELRAKADNTDKAIEWATNHVEEIIKERDALRAKLYKAEIERGVMFEEYDKLRASTITHEEWYAKCNEVEELRAKLDAWEKQSPVAWATKNMTHILIKKSNDDPHFHPLFTKPKEA